MRRSQPLTSSRKHTFIVLPLLLPVLVFSLTCSAIDEPQDTTGILIAPLEDDRAVGDETPAEFGIVLSKKLTALFALYLPEDSNIEMLDRDVLAMTLDEEALVLKDVVTRDNAEDVGELLGADYVWYGSYSLHGSQIQGQLGLWSLHTAQIEDQSVVLIEPAEFVDDAAYVEALACRLFYEMYRITVGVPPPIECAEVSPFGLPLPRIIVVETPFPVGELLVAPHVTVAGVKLAAVNNVIEHARRTEGLVMDDIRWSPGVGLRAGYSFAGGLEGVAALEFGRAYAHAGLSGNVSMTISSTGILAGLAYHMRVSGIELMLEARGGWQGALLDVVDHWGVLDCPSQVAGQGIGFEVLVSLEASVLPGLTVHAQIGYRGADLATASMRLPRIDLTGPTLRIGLGMSFGGRSS